MTEKMLLALKQSVLFSGIRGQLFAELGGGGARGAVAGSGSTSPGALHAPVQRPRRGGGARGTSILSGFYFGFSCKQISPDGWYSSSNHACWG